LYVCNGKRVLVSSIHYGARTITLNIFWACSLFFISSPIIPVQAPFSSCTFLLQCSPYWLSHIHSSPVQFIHNAGCGV
jgi:hypothetical protein